MDATSSQPAPQRYADLQERLGGLTLQDAERLRHRLAAARRRRDPARRHAELDDLTGRVAAAERRVERRRAAVPVITYPEELPVSRRRDDIAAAIREHQVVVVAGETGSGKTTQLPKICLELGRGVRGTIGHTQPRRIAARSVAERIAEELDVPLGDAVGYTVRFTDKASERTLVRVMTDGVLLAEIQRDPMLLRYDTLVVDEAHERSLNVDFLLGYLARLLPRRPDLTLVITSATIDPERFARHFGGAPVVEVSGRTYPVEVRYRPLVEESSDDGAGDQEQIRDQVTAITDAVHELDAEAPGDVLVFLSGEREIRDTADALRGMPLRDTEIVPLYARLSAAEQHRVFAPHDGRRIVLATNVAETSLTVPGIRYVVDPGTARISRYSQRTKVQRLPIEPVSRASANQRAGRCGRLSDGICVRLYSEEDFLARPEFTDPEILRTSLASVILQMAALGLGDVEAFPFVDPPDGRSIRDGVVLLEELGALDPRQTDRTKRLTALGRRLARLPLDPRLARMVLAAEGNGCVEEVLVIVAAMTVQDPRERPVEQQQQAAQQHARFRHETSDLLSYLVLWRYLQEQQDTLSSSAFRRLCKREFLHYLRIREWQDLVAQLRQAVTGLEIELSSAPQAEDAIHQALLAGLLSQIGMRETTTGESRRKDFLGARGAHFAVNPGSALFRNPPAWVMAGELVETTRLWARDVARIQPEWAEVAGAHLVKRSYSEPRWSRKRGSVVAQERVTLFGVPVVASRTVQYGSIDPELSRDLFLRHALVEGAWQTHHQFFAQNRELLEDVEELEHRARRRDIVVDDETLFSFYDRRVPLDVVSGRHFDAWWKQARRADPELLTFTRDMLVREDSEEVSEEDFPDAWRQGDLVLPLSYQFEPGTDADGVTVHVPVALLNQVTASGFDWQVPGLRAELLTALIRSLPKSIRTQLVPAPDRARAVLAALPPEPDGRPLTTAVAEELERSTAVRVPAGAWDVGRVPAHLRVTFRVEDDEGRPLAEGRDLGALRERLAPQARVAVATSTGSALERTGLLGWDLGTVPRVVEEEVSGHTVRGYPALVDEGGTVALRVLGTPHEQRRAMRAGTRRLLSAVAPPPVRAVQARLGNTEKLALARNPHGSVTALLDDCVAAAVDVVVDSGGGPAWDAEGFAQLERAVQERLADVLGDVVTTVARILQAAHGVESRIDEMASLVLLPALTDVRTQLDGLVHRGFVTDTGVGRLPDLLRYLRGIERRLDRLPEDPVRDRDRMGAVQRLTDDVTAALDRLPAERRDSAEAQQLPWMLEELRVSLFAQGLGTAYPVSEKRVRATVSRLAG